MKVHAIKDDIYNADIYVIPKCTPDDLIRFFKRRYKYDYEHDATYGAFHYQLSEPDKGWTHHFLIFDEFENSPSGIGQFNHELLHLVSAIMRIRCLKHIEETEEAYAYYMGYLTEKILEKIC